MRTYTSKSAGIAGMHSRGFTHDFQLFDNKLLWIQEKTFIKMDEFTIIEHHRFSNSLKKPSHPALFGIFLHNFNIKGILLNEAIDFNGKKLSISRRAKRKKELL